MLFLGTDALLPTKYNGEPKRSCILANIPDLGTLHTDKQDHFFRVDDTPNYTSTTLGNRLSIHPRSGM